MINDSRFELDLNCLWTTLIEAESTKISEEKPSFQNFCDTLYKKHSKMRLNLKERAHAFNILFFFTINTRKIDGIAQGE